MARLEGCFGGYFRRRGNCPIVGLGSFCTLAFWAPKARPMYRTAHPKGSLSGSTNYNKVYWKDKELSALTAAWPDAGRMALAAPRRENLWVSGAFRAEPEGQQQAAL